MPRHSKNATATTHFTYEEKRKAGHGTIKKRLGKDSLVPFGCCALSLDKVKDPLVSPSGFLYCKECIYENLLSQKAQIQTDKEAYEQYLIKKQIEEEEVQLKDESKKIEKFIAIENGSSSSTSTNSMTSKEKLVAQLATKVDKTSREEKLDNLKRTSFWAPEFTPNAQTVVPKPDTVTKDPMTSIPMKLKHLMPVKIEWSSSKSSSPHPLCALTKKEITHQQAVLLRPSGLIILESCLKDMVLPTMTCPVTSVKLRKKDLIYLQTGGTSFSAHNKVEAKKYRPSMT